MTGDVEQLGPVVQIRGDALVDLYRALHYMRAGSEVRKFPLPRRFEALWGATAAACAELPQRHCDTLTSDEGVGWISAKVAADLLGVHIRSVQRAAPHLAGEMFKGAWRFPVRVVEAEAAARRLRREAP